MQQGAERGQNKGRAPKGHVMVKCSQEDGSSATKAELEQGNFLTINGNPRSPKPHTSMCEGEGTACRTVGTICRRKGECSGRQTGGRCACWCPGRRAEPGEWDLKRTQRGQLSRREGLQAPVNGGLGQGRCGWEADAASRKLAPRLSVRTSKHRHNSHTCLSEPPGPSLSTVSLSPHTGLCLT